MTKTPLSEVEVWDAGKLSDAHTYYISNENAKRVVGVMVHDKNRRVELFRIEWDDVPDGDYENAYMGPMHSDILNIARRMI